MVKYVLVFALDGWNDSRSILWCIMLYLIFYLLVLLHNTMSYIILYLYAFLAAPFNFSVASTLKAKQKSPRYLYYLFATSTIIILLFIQIQNDYTISLWYCWLFKKKTRIFSKIVFFIYVIMTTTCLIAYIVF